MVRRTLVIVVFAVLALTCAAQVPALGAGADGASRARRGATGTLTFLPAPHLVRFGKTITVRGSLTSAGAPVAGAAVLVHRLGQTTGSTAVTNAQGLYQATVTPRANATWAASAGEVQSDAVLIQVRPRVTLALSHSRSTSRLTEYFSGSVSPGHAGARMVVQRSTASGWRTVASGRLDAGSRYRIPWVLPHRTADVQAAGGPPGARRPRRGHLAAGDVRVVVTQG